MSVSTMRGRYWNSVSASLLERILLGFASPCGFRSRYWISVSGPYRRWGGWLPTPFPIPRFPEEIPEKFRKRSQSVSWNFPREYGWDAPNPIIQGIWGSQSSTAGDSSFVRIGSGEALSEPVMEFPAVLGGFLNSRAGNGCTNFIGTWDVWLFLQETSMPIRFLVLGGNFFWGGGEG